MRLAGVVTSSFVTTFPGDNRFIDRKCPAHFEMKRTSLIAFLHQLADLPKAVGGVSGLKLLIAQVPVAAAIKRIKNALKASKGHALSNPRLCKDTTPTPNVPSTLNFYDTQVSTNCQELPHLLARQLPPVCIPSQTH
jgi:hypothetical protein